MIPTHVERAVDEALRILPAQMDTPQARVMVFAIGLQESQFEHRRQLIKKGGALQPIGPAKSYWQGEVTGGMCSGIRTRDATRYWVHHLCGVRGVAFTARAIWNAIEHDDVLAAGCARLLLFSDPKKLPAIDDARSGWNLYARTWRPGQPHRETWEACHGEAVRFVTRPERRGLAV